MGERGSAFTTADKAPVLGEGFWHAVGRHEAWKPMRREYVIDKTNYDLEWAYKPNTALL